MLIDISHADELDNAQLRALLARVAQENRRQHLTIDKLTHEMATLKRMKFARRSEAFVGVQRSLLDEDLDTDLHAIAAELEPLIPERTAPAHKNTPRRTALPPELPRREIRHEPAETTCACGCQLQRIGEDIAEKLDYVPGIFTVERHIRGKWACTHCRTLIQAPIPPHVIDKGLPTTGLLAQVLVAKYQDHLPLYRQQAIFERAGIALPRSTLAQWVGACGVALLPLVAALKAEILAHRIVHADETPVKMLDPGAGKTHRAYLWCYSPGAFESLKAVVYDFTESRAAKHAQAFLNDWRGTLICDDYAGYKPLIATGITEAGCMAHARRKFHDLWVNHQSVIAQEALVFIQQLYAIEEEVRPLDADERRRIRQCKSRPITDTLHGWLSAQRQKVPDGSAIARAIDYSLKRWNALTLYLKDGMLPIDNNHIENQVRPVAVGRSNWLFAGSLRAGQRSAVVMSLINSARLNGLDPYRYLKDVLERLPTHRARDIAELLPHHWQPTSA